MENPEADEHGVGATPMVTLKAIKKIHNIWGSWLSAIFIIHLRGNDIICPLNGMQIVTDSK